MKTLYQKVRVKKAYAYFNIVISSLFYTLAVQAFVQVAHTLTAGVSAIALVPTMIFDDIRPYVGLIYLGLNIPLIIIFWKKLKREFIYKTSFFLICQAGFGALFFIDALKDAMESLIINPDRVLKETWPVFILASLGGVFVGLSTSIAWKFGGSSAGGDIFAYYYSTKRKRPVGAMMFIVSMVFVVISFSITVAMDSEIRDNAMTILIATIIYVGITSIVINLVYPKYSIVLVEIHTEKTKEITKYFKDTKYVHSWQIREATSGFSGVDRTITSTVMLLLEFKTIKREILEIDPQAWITVSNVRQVIGNFDTKKVD